MKTILKNVFLIGTGLLVCGLLRSQTIEIGMSNDQVKTLIAWTTKDHNRTDSYGNKTSSYWTWDVKYFNGNIVEVIQCYQNQFLSDFVVIANYCKHYLMENNKLSYVLSVFQNVSIELIKENYESTSGKNKIYELYFSDDFEYYSKIYLNNNGLTTIEWRKTIISELPLNIQQEVNSKLTNLRIEFKKKKEKELQESQTQKEFDKHERLHTILNCSDFNEGLSFVLIGSEQYEGGGAYDHVPPFLDL